ncbi:MAG: gliding motility-associated protein GldE [Salinivirgaceae bacterium]|nr:gliding motility-associated protein GldE [Salinivirgaceae bacterium]
MDPEPYSTSLEKFLQVDFTPITPEIVIGFIILLVLIAISACISGSEVAFFSLKPKDISHFKTSIGKISRTVIKLIENPKKLLSTILVTNNFVNIGIIILSSYITTALIDFSNAPILGFIFQVITITFLLLLFGEIIPKVYATHNYIGFTKFMALPLLYFGKFFSPISHFLIFSTSIVDKKVKKEKHISIDELGDALALTEKNLDEEKAMLKGIVDFTSTTVSEILRPRVDVIAVDIDAEFDVMMNQIIDSGYSRIPVYKNTFDNVQGVLYIKDLLPHIHSAEGISWPKLIRPPYFVPENKKINDLLGELQDKKIHLAIVVDEYGGTCGIVTLEDILEEIVGDISDEFDEQKSDFVKVNANTYLFEGKISLNDFCRHINYEGDLFDDSNADTLAGFILEHTEEIPRVYEKFEYKRFILQVESADHRRIKKVKVVLKNG